jgi:hypothetical protein
MTLWVLRWAFGKIATISPKHLPENTPPILCLLKTEKDQDIVYLTQYINIFMQIFIVLFFESQPILSESYLPAQQGKGRH